MKKNLTTELNVKDKLVKVMRVGKKILMLLELYQVVVNIV